MGGKIREDLIQLKAEVFDLIQERDRIQNEINTRMIAINAAATEQVQTNII